MTVPFLTLLLLSIIVYIVCRHDQPYHIPCISLSHVTLNLRRVATLRPQCYLADAYTCPWYALRPHLEDGRPASPFFDIARQMLLSGNPFVHLQRVTATASFVARGRGSPSLLVFDDVFSDTLLRNLYSHIAGADLSEARQTELNCHIGDDVCCTHFLSCPSIFSFPFHHYIARLTD